MKKELTFVIIIALIIIFYLFFYIKNNIKDTSKLKIYFFEAGKADSIVIYNDDFAVLIDTGEKELGDTILNYFENNNITKLDYLIITHFDKDHVGSAYKIIKKIQVDNILQSNSPKESNVYEKYIEALNEANITPITVREKLNFEFGEIKFTVNPPIEEEYSNKPSNNSSLITSVFYKNTKYLFMGDAEVDRINEFISDNSITYDFIKIPYHGHYQSNLENLINNIQPQYAVITSSDDEPEDEETLSILSNNNVKVYLTRKGDITLSSDGTTINILQ